MPDDDTMLAQHTVDFRNEERGERGRAHQTAICTSDTYCQADADEHNPDCPIEAELRETFRF